MNITGILLTIILLIISVSVGIAAYFANSFFVLEKIKAENKARYECAMVYRYEVRTDNTTISYPPQDLYEECLEEKGL